MITVLRNNSKILTQQEKSLNIKLHQLKKEDPLKRNRLMGDIQNYHTNQERNDSLKTHTSGSKGIFLMLQNI